ncbi:amidophosphoribosyltransferase [Candidatus Peregrinibacteria bacterium HGW-Peregrinibacteria-1]|jgi:amidophosphoribosyltransferase|nr:MAG: amidophosphoribosyltransferase [Candidatus Peregrinibacteria bacterium HGW-Peregrinibacteria-1]
MCGIIGIYGYDQVAQDLYDGLVTLQHRGQDAAGIGTFDGKFHFRKAYGLVTDVFTDRHVPRLTGYVGIGHTRYATIGTGDIGELQPFYDSAPFGVMMAHNGNLFNSRELKKEIFEKDHRMVNSDSDGEVILNLFTNALSRFHDDVITPESVWKAVESVQTRAKGAYSIVAYIGKQGFVAFRDPYGIRPLLMGVRDKGIAKEYIFASESVTLDILGFDLVGDVGPGEAVFIDERTRTVHRRTVVKKGQAPCVFEYVYFARPDSMIDGISVYKARMRMGQKLAGQIKDAGLDIDVVMPVPDSSRSAALALASELEVKYSEGLVKNRYVGRTFIMPGQEKRKKSIRYKLNPIPLEINGKNVLLVDDSIVRGNTSRQIIEMVRRAGAKKIYFCSYSPPVRYPNLYGIDIATQEELVAANVKVEDIGALIGADELFYGDIDDMKEACLEGNPNIKDMDMSCFDGRYVTGDVTEEVLREQSSCRSQERPK